MTCYARSWSNLREPSGTSSQPTVEAWVRFRYFGPARSMSRVSSALVSRSHNAVVDAISCSTSQISCQLSDQQRARGERGGAGTRSPQAQMQQLQGRTGACRGRSTKFRSFIGTSAARRPLWQALFKPSLGKLGKLALHSVSAVKVIRSARHAARPNHVPQVTDLT